MIIYLLFCLCFLKTNPEFDYYQKRFAHLSFNLHSLFQAIERILNY
jgi:hypothetical protein